MRWVVVSLMIGCGGAPSSGAESADLEWLGGSWRAGDGPGGDFELWGKDEGGGWLGLSVHVDPPGNARDAELMWIEPDAAALVAMPGARRTRFRRGASTEGSVRFEAPEHDSPKWIRYRRDGEGLEATIGDADEPSARWRFQPVRGEPMVQRGRFEVCREGERMTVTQRGCFCGAQLTCGVVDDPLPLRVAILDHSCDACEPAVGECGYDDAVALADGECGDRDAVTLFRADLR